MLTKKQIKQITRLKQKKYRIQDQLFVVEGLKTIEELLQSDIILRSVYTTEHFNSDAKKEVLISESDLKRISFLKSPNKALAVFEIPKPKPIETNQLLVALDNIRDPGNLGTIIRLCDWFGITNLVCSLETADCFNPKVIQATMGSIARVNVTYLDLADFITQHNMPVFGAFMDGDSVYQSKLPDYGILLMGNEAHGISEDLQTLVTDRMAIPRFGKLQETESLNVAMATGILLSEFKRRTL